MPIDLVDVTGRLPRCLITMQEIAQYAQSRILFSGARIAQDALWAGIGPQNGDGSRDRKP